VSGEKPTNILRTAQQQALAPAVLNTASVQFAEAVAEQQIGARSKRVHKLVASTTNISCAQATEYIHKHD
jgi:hypothetical protein